MKKERKKCLTIQKMKKLIYEIKSQSEKFGNLKTDELEKEIVTNK
jgi:hypothetical protein